ncbi:TPA: hypothetical protein JBF73_07685 [Legionella pneumophila]|nr:hypothetical protein [Legionella pneumophila]
MKLTALYGTLFTKKHGVEDNGTWFQVLKDLTPMALHNGMNKLMTLEKGNQFCEFPPSSLQFRALCLGYYSDLKLPTPASAHREVLNRAYTKNTRWSHPVVQYTAFKLGHHFAAIENEGESFALFSDAYEQVCHLVRQGRPIPEMAQVPLMKKPQSKEVAMNHLTQMRQALGVGR